jgi:membrane protein YdbS with pleckstrin-like domain
MTGWYILLGIIAIVAIIATYKLNPDAWIAVTICAAVIITGLGFYSAYKHMSVRYQLTTHRFVIQTGVLSRTDNRILLVDVDDISVHQGMVERMFNLGTIHLRTTDETTKEESPDKKDPVKGLVVMDGIENPRQVADMIDESRRAERTRRGVYMMNA